LIIHGLHISVIAVLDGHPFSVLISRPFRFQDAVPDISYAISSWKKETFVIYVCSAQNRFDREQVMTRKRYPACQIP
jgi:hypothetical protein